MDLEAAYTAERANLLRLAVLLVGDLGLAEDIVQDAFASLMAVMPLRSPNAVPAYLRTSVVNRARDAMRRQQTVRRFLSSTRVIHAPPADDGLLIGDAHRQVIQALRTLPARQQQVLVLRYWSQMSEADIAQLLRVSVGTVKSSASRGLRRLATLIER